MHLTSEFPITLADPAMGEVACVPSDVICFSFSCRFRKNLAK